ncbi:PIR Superfamily Protein [Plasmodium ovale wallikeri]|uniref:PIR Superfamily Protein n=1 Tax=Plasmodium ovale wallikeri TaxID=864142 RepID=A0A1A9AFN6_PLAOA|nr:PIR Superfamily Protein [Plasmodium ovale wallikeri]SBT58193.1 PIR Superfamily Protein [Plasmodium ovale wallikeri]
MRQESYDFFKYFDEYIEYEKSIEKEWNVRVYKKECAFDGRYYTGYLKGEEIICAKLKCFYNSLFHSLLSDNKHKEYAEYLNFWVNTQLKNNIIPPTTVKNFYDNVKFYDIFFDLKKKLEDKIYDINKEEFTNMKFLYDLYRNYYDILITTKASTGNYNCLEYSKKCVQVYDEAIKKCPTDATLFCKALHVFKEKYDGINNNDSLKNCKEKKLPPLPEYKSPRIDSSASHVGESKAVEEPNDLSEHASTPYFSYVFGFTATILGIFLTLLILFKGEKMRTNLEEEYNQELVLNDSDLEHPYSENMSYNIPYNSTLNA